MFVAFAMIMFSIIGVQSFNGSYKRSCEWIGSFNLLEARARFPIPDPIPPRSDGTLPERHFVPDVRWIHQCNDRESSGLYRQHDWPAVWGGKQRLHLPRPEYLHRENIFPRILRYFFLIAWSFRNRQTPTMAP